MNSYNFKWGNEGIIRLSIESYKVWDFLIECFCFCFCIGDVHPWSTMTLLLEWGWKIQNCYITVTAQGPMCCSVSLWGRGLTGWRWTMTLQWTLQSFYKSTIPYCVSFGLSYPSRLGRWRSSGGLLGTWNFPLRFFLPSLFCPIFLFLTFSNPPYPWRFQGQWSSWAVMAVVGQVCRGRSWGGVLSPLHGVSMLRG